MLRQPLASTAATDVISMSVMSGPDIGTGATPAASRLGADEIIRLHRTMSEAAACPRSPAGVLSELIYPLEE